MVKKCSRIKNPSIIPEIVPKEAPISQTQRLSGSKLGNLSAWAADLLRRERRLPKVTSQIKASSLTWP